MEIQINKAVSVAVALLYVDAGPRYFEDSTINGVPDTEEGDNMPCIVHGRWRPLIDIATGTILNWEKGKTASVHYKVCDDGVYILRDADCNDMLVKDGYVPKCMCPTENGYGDYIIMNIDAEGKIQNWKATFNDFQ